MDANEYQLLAGRTLLKEPDQTANEMEWVLLFNALKQAVEVGKTVEVLKKQICHRQGLDLIMAVNELGFSGSQRQLTYPYPPTITPEQYMVVWNLTGLIGEAAELTSVFLEHIASGGKIIDKQKGTKELGDVLWYVAACATKFNLFLSDVMVLNIQKLKARYPEGYTSADSMNREGAAE